MKFPEHSILPVRVRAKAPQYLLRRRNHSKDPRKKTQIPDSRTTKSKTDRDEKLSPTRFVEIFVSFGKIKINQSVYNFSPKKKKKTFFCLPPSMSYKVTSYLCTNLFQLVPFAIQLLVLSADLLHPVIFASYPSLSQEKTPNRNKFNPSSGNKHRKIRISNSWKWD